MTSNIESYKLIEHTIKEGEYMNLDELCQRIRHAGPEEINDILQTAFERYRILFPNDEILYLSLPKNNPQERQRLLQMIQNLL